jgi:hypothetical protein
LLTEEDFQRILERPSPATSIALTHSIIELERSLCQNNSNIDMMRCGANNYTTQIIRDELAGDIKSSASRSSAAILQLHAQQRLRSACL